MSFSEPKQSNPATKFIDFRDGQFVYYDKEKQDNVTISLPIYFIVLDELSTISGYCEKHNCGIFSNEVHRVTDEVLNVRTFKGNEQIIGLYKDISDSVARIGGKYTKSVYALLLDKNKEPELVNFRFRGAAFSAWLDKKFNPEKYITAIVGTHEATKGKTIYQVPEFDKFNLTPAHNEKAIEADKQLQKYLKTYKAIQVEKDKSEEVITPEVVDDFQAKDEWMGQKKDITPKPDNKPLDLPF